MTDIIIYTSKFNGDNPFINGREQVLPRDTVFSADASLIEVLDRAGVPYDLAPATGATTGNVIITKPSPFGDYVPVTINGVVARLLAGVALLLTPAQIEALTAAKVPFTYERSSASVGTPATLTLPYDGLYVAEGAGAGTKVASPVGLASGATRSIQGVKNLAGTPVSSSMFALSGSGNGDIVCGITPTAAADVGYEITYREVGNGQTVDTLLYVYVVALPTYVAPYIETFTGTNGDTLVHASRPRWSGTAPGLTINGSNQLASQAAVNSTAVIDTGSNNQYMKIKLGGMIATANTMRFHLRYTDSQNKVECYISTTDNGTQGGRIAFYQYHGGLAAVSLGVPPFMGAANSTNAEIEIRIVDNRLSCYVNGVLIFGPVDVSIVPPSGKIALNSQSAAIATVASTWDDFECGQYGDVSAAPDPVPVYSVDPVALKAQVPVRASFTGTAPTAMQYRIVNSAGTAISGYDWADWSTCVIGASGVAGHVLMPEGTTGSAAALWAVEIRDTNNTTRTCRASPKGIGDVLAFAGQSHNQRLFTTATATDSNDGFAFVTNASVSLAPTFPGNRPITAFLNTLIPLTKRPCMAVCLAFDGASSTNLKPGSANFTTTLAWLRLYARRFNGWMLSNGEQNIQLATQSVYVSEWTETFAAYGTYTGQKMSDLPIGISHTHGLIGPAVTKQGSAEITRYLDQRRYEDQLRAALGSSAYISHHRHDCRYNATDYIHTEPADMRDIHAPRYARGYAWKIGKAANGWKGPEFSSIARMSATKRRGYLTMNGATGLTDNDATNPGDLTGGYQFVAATGYNGSQDPNSYFGATPAATPPITGFTTTYGFDGTNYYVDWDFPSDPGAVAMRYPAAKSAPAAGGAEVWDGGQPFGLAYETTGAIRLPGAQIQGDYGGGVLVGITPMINALAVA